MYFKENALAGTEDRSSNLIRYVYGNLVEGRRKFARDKMKEKKQILQCKPVKDTKDFHKFLDMMKLLNKRHIIIYEKRPVRIWKYCL